MARQALYVAAGTGHTEVLAFLLANRADVNALDNVGATPLHSAAINGRRNTAELPFSNKADAEC